MTGTRFKVAAVAVGGLGELFDLADRECPLLEHTTSLFPSHVA